MYIFSPELKVNYYENRIILKSQTIVYVMGKCLSLVIQSSYSDEVADMARIALVAHTKKTKD